MAIDSVKAKLHEARSALSEMREEEQKAAGESRYDYRMAAFLSAARSVDYRLRFECPNTYPNWRKQWDAQHSAEDSLLVFINSKRADDVHKRGSGRTSKTEEIKIGTGSAYSDKGGKVESWGSASALMGVDTSAIVSQHQYFFDDRPATDVCAQALAILEQMVTQFEADTSPLNI
jgi:hypothetical protein